jgi:hypothetical protein
MEGKGKVARGRAKVKRKEQKNERRSGKTRCRQELEEEFEQTC